MYLSQGSSNDVCHLKSSNNQKVPGETVDLLIMSLPKVSFGLPVYNGERYLRQAMDSLLNQDFEDFEIVISDNASTDATAEMCRAYAARDKRIRYYRTESNIGSGPNFRRVFELARGDFFKWCAHDDTCGPTFASRCMQVFESAPSSVVLVYPQCTLIDESGNVLGVAEDHVETKHKRASRRLSQVLRNVSYAYPIRGLIRSSCLRKTRLTGTTAYWDMALLIELSLYGEIWEVPEVLMQQRCHPGNAVAIYSAEQSPEVASDPSKADRATREKLLTWTDPSQTGKTIWLPIHEERYWEYLKRVHHAPLPPFEKGLCYLMVPVLGYWCRFRKIGGLWKRKLLAKPPQQAMGKAKP